jgi:hypothetical protein
VELPIGEGGVIEVVCCTELSETPGSVGTSEVGWVELELGLSSDSELDGSISSERLLGADGSTRFVSIGGWMNVEGVSELEPEVDVVA